VHHKSMDIINKIPRTTLVLLVLFLAALFIMLGDPPKDACDAQLEVFLSSQAGRLSSLRGSVNSLWMRTAKYCKETKTLGGCAEFHDTVRFALRDIKNAPAECVPRLIQQEWLQKILFDSMSLMVQMAWGEKAPEVGPNVYGWMGMSEFSVFCGVKKHVEHQLPDEEWESYVRRTISKLPDSKQFSFQEAFERSLFSLRCDSIY
jgi:hypothetical protein